MKTTKILYDLTCIWGLFFVTACESTKQSKGLSIEARKYTNHTLDYSEIIGREYAIIETTIKEKTILIKAVKSDSTFFIGVDILTGNKLYNIADPSNDYVSSTFDYSHNKIFSLSSLKPSKLNITDINNHVELLKEINFNNKSRPGRLLTNNSQIFLINDVWGIGVINQNDKEKLKFQNSGNTGLGNPESSTISFPIDNTLNLLAGHLVENNLMQLYAITNQSNIKWQYKIQINSMIEAVSILNLPDKFVLKQDKKIVALNKENGKEIWQKEFKNIIKEIYKFGDKVLVYSLTNPIGTLSAEPESVMELRFLDCKNGQEFWSYKSIVANTVSLGITNYNLLISDNNTFTVLSLDNGQEVEKTNLSSKQDYNFNFEIIADITTGEYYLKTFDGKLYW